MPRILSDLIGTLENDFAVGRASDEVGKVRLRGKTSGGAGESVTTSFELARGSKVEEFKDYGTADPIVLRIRGAEDVSIGSIQTGREALRYDSATPLISIGNATDPLSVLSNTTFQDETTFTKGVTVSPTASNPSTASPGSDYTIWTRSSDGALMYGPDVVAGPGVSELFGSGTATQITFFTAGNTVSSDAELTWDSTNNLLGIDGGVEFVPVVSNPSPNSPGMDSTLWTRASDGALMFGGTMVSSAITGTATNRYYVDRISGSDTTGTGAVTNPFATIQAAMDAIGDATSTPEYENYNLSTFVIDVAPGDYVENVTTPLRQVINIHLHGAAKIIGDVTFPGDTTLGGSSHPPRLTITGDTNRAGFASAVVPRVGVEGNVYVGDESLTNPLCIFDGINIYITGDIICGNTSGGGGNHTQIFGHNMAVKGAIKNETATTAYISLFLMNTDWNEGSGHSIGDLGASGAPAGANNIRIKSAHNVEFNGNIYMEDSAAKDWRLKDCIFNGTIDANGSAATIEMDAVTRGQWISALGGSDTSTISLLETYVSGSVTQVAYFDSNDTVGGVSNFTWDDVNNLLGIDGGIEFVPVASNPSPNSPGNASTLWTRSSDGALMFGPDVVAGPGVGEVFGSGAANRLAFWSGSSTLTSDSNLTWDNTTLAIGPTLSAAGDEAVLDLSYTVNKPSGDDVGILINYTDTSSPGTSYFVRFRSGGSDVFSIAEDGDVNMTNNFNVTRTFATGNMFDGQVVGDADERFSGDVSGNLEWGDGTGARDAFFGRESAALLATGIGTDFHVRGTTASTSSTTGALVVDGGVGIQGDQHIDGDIVVSAGGSTTLTIGISGANTNFTNDNGNDFIRVGGNPQDEAIFFAFDGIVFNNGSGNQDFTANKNSSGVWLGYNAGNDTIVLGSDSYFGNGVTNASPIGVTIGATGGSGTDIAGADLTLAGGIGTGTGLAGDLVLAFAPASTTGSTPNTLINVLKSNVADPSAYAAAADVDGQDIYFRSQSGGAHTANNPRGADIIFTPGAAGSGGAGRAGEFRVVGTAHVTGKLTVDGLIDPTGLELTPVAANPGGVASNTVWLDSGNGDIWTFGGSLAPLTIDAQSVGGGALTLNTDGSHYLQLQVNGSNTWQLNNASGDLQFRNNQASNTTVFHIDSTANNNQMIRLDTGDVTINNGAEDVDFHIVKNGGGDAFLYNAGLNRFTLSSRTDVTATTQSTSTTSGAFILSGGAGIAKNIHGGGTLDINGVATFLKGISSGTNYRFDNFSDDWIYAVGQVHSNTYWHAVYYTCERSRGTAASRASVQAGDVLLGLEGKAYVTGASSARGTGLIALVESVGANAVSSYWSMYVHADDGDPSNPGDLTVQSWYSDRTEINQSGIDYDWIVHGISGEAGRYDAGNDEWTFSANTTINGKLTVTGLIDPTGLELTPQASNPGGTAANTVWLDSGNQNRWTFENKVTFTGVSLTSGTEESALSIAYDTNKSGGNDIGLLIERTQTAAPGENYLLMLRNGGSDVFSVKAGGDVTITNNIVSVRSGAADNSWETQVTGDADRRFILEVDGRMKWGDGTGGQDTELFRVSANRLATETGDDFLIQGTTISTSSTTGALVVNGGVGIAGVTNHADNVFVSTDGSSTGSPRIIGMSNFSSGEAAQFQFGDSFNAIANGHSKAMEIVAYHSLILRGDANGGGSGVPQFPNTSDIGVLVDNSTASSPALVVRGASAQTGNLQQWRDSGDAVLVSIASNGDTNIASTTETAGSGGALTAGSILTEGGISAKKRIWAQNNIESALAIIGTSVKAGDSYSWSGVGANQVATLAPASLDFGNATTSHTATLQVLGTTIVTLFRDDSTPSNSLVTIGFNTTIDGRLKLTSQAGTTTEGSIWFDSTQKAMQIFADGIEQTLSGVIFTQTADQTIANTTTETTLLGSGVGTLTLPADFFVAGKTVRLVIHGQVGDTGTPTVNLRLKLGSTDVVDSTALTFDTLGSTEQFQIEAVLTCRTTGVTGTVEGMIYFTYLDTSGASNVRALDILPNNVSIDTTVSQVLDLTFQWGTADPANTITSNLASVEILN